MTKEPCHDRRRDLLHDGLGGACVPFVATEIMPSFLAWRACCEPLALNQMNFGDAIDIVMPLDRFTDGMDWDHVLLFSKKRGVAPPLHLCLKHIGHLAPVQVAPETFEFLERVLLVQPEFDLGNFMPTRFGVKKRDPNDSAALRALSGQRVLRRRPGRR